MALLLRNAGSLGASVLGRDNSRGPCSRTRVYVQWKVVERLAKIMGDMTAATDMCGRGGKEVFVGRKGFGVSDAVAKHMLVMV